MHKLACNGDSNKDKVISLLINANANVNAQDNQGRTPLFDACSSRGFNVEMALINQNADITHKDHNDNTFLHNLFLSLGVFDWDLKILYAVGQVIQHQPYMLNLANKDGKTPLICAAFGNKEKQEGESISDLGLRHTACLIRLIQENNATISVSSDELERLNLALEQSKQQNLQKPTTATTSNIDTISLFLSQHPKN